MLQLMPCFSVFRAAPPTSPSIPRPPSSYNPPHSHNSSAIPLSIFGYHQPYGCFHEAHIHLHFFSFYNTGWHFAHGRRRHRPYLHLSRLPAEEVWPLVNIIVTGDKSLQINMHSCCLYWLEHVAPGAKIVERVPLEFNATTVDW
jgi:hypothetical protein